MPQCDLSMPLLLLLPVVVAVVAVPLSLMLLQLEHLQLHHPPALTFVVLTNSLMKTRSHTLLGCRGTCLVGGRQCVKVAVIDVQAYAIRLKTPNTQPKNLK